MDNLAAELEAYEDKLRPFMDGSANGEASKPSHNNIINNSLYKGNDDNLATSGNFLSLNRRENDLKNIMSSLIKGGLSEKETAQLIEYLMLSWNDVPDTKWIAETIENAKSSTSRRERNLAQEIRELILSSNGVFLSSDVVKELGLSSRVVIQNASKILNRLCKEKSPLIEPYGNKRGCFRRIDKDFERMDIMAASGEEYKIKLPLDLHEEGILYPGNLGVIAGSKESSKTAMMLNIAKLNLGKRRIVYLNSEMGVNEFRNRLLNFDDVPLETWNTQMEIYRMKSSQSPADFIDGSDTIWLIDYLEIAEDFSKIALPITQIHEKLGKGLAFIAIQKADGKDVGRGADFSREKARLYLSLDWDHSKRMNRVKIIDFKAWRGKNPRGLMRYYKLVMGARIIPQGNWEE